MTAFESRAWLLEGATKSIPGMLYWDGNALTFVACGPGKFSEHDIQRLADRFAMPDGTCAAILKEQPSPLLRASKGEISGYKMPWYYFKGGIHITIRNQSYKFSFIRPQNTVEPSYYLEDQYRWAGGAGQEDVDVLGGKAAGAQWKQLLENILV